MSCFLVLKIFSCVLNLNREMPLRAHKNTLRSKRTTHKEKNLPRHMCRVSNVGIATARGEEWTENNFIHILEGTIAVPPCPNPSVVPPCLVPVAICLYPRLRLGCSRSHCSQTILLTKWGFVRVDLPVPQMLWATESYYFGLKGILNRIHFYNCFDIFWIVSPDMTFCSVIFAGPLGSIVSWDFCIWSLKEVGKYFARILKLKIEFVGVFFLFLWL